jgi:fructan beta-fructosidase
MGEREMTTIGYRGKSQTLFIDRSQSGQVQFSDVFPSIHVAEPKPIEGVIRLHIFVDRSSIEVFGNDGLVVFTDQIFPCSEITNLEIFADGGKVALNSLDIYELTPATFHLPAEINQ